MENIFSNYGIIISKNREKWFITYDEGEIVSREVTREITEEDAIIARKSAEDAYRVIIKYQNMDIGY